LKLPTNREEQSRATLARSRRCLQFSQRKIAMVRCETVHFFQARSIVIPNEPGAMMAGALIRIRVAEGAAARDVTRKSFRAQEV